jgi:hypothetical protein
LHNELGRHEFIDHEPFETSWLNAEGSKGGGVRVKAIQINDD